MTSLLGSFEASAKKPFQTYTIEHGIERITVLVPVPKVQVFEQSFSKLSDKSKTSILQLVEEVGGKVRS